MAQTDVCRPLRGLRGNFSSLLYGLTNELGVVIVKSVCRIAVYPNSRTAWRADKKTARPMAAPCCRQRIRDLFARGILEIVDRFLVTELVGHDLFGRVILTSVAAVADRLGRNHKAV